MFKCPRPHMFLYDCVYVEATFQWTMYNVYEGLRVIVAKKNVWAKMRKQNIERKSVTSICGICPTPFPITFSLFTFTLSHLYVPRMSIVSLFGYPNPNEIVAFPFIHLFVHLWEYDSNRFVNIVYYWHSIDITMDNAQKTSGQSINLCIFINSFALNSD